MGLFSRRETIIDNSALEDPLLRALLGQPEITRDHALEIPVVSGCVDLVCNIFASIPFKLYKEGMQDGKKTTTEIKDERVALLNEDTKDKLDGFQFKKAMCEDYLLGKGGYAYIKKVGNNFKGLYYVEDKFITVQTNDDHIFKNYSIIVGAKSYHDYDFLKLLRNTKNGAEGIGLTREIASALNTAYQRVLYEYDLTVTGGSRKGFIKSQKHLDDKSMKALKEAWQSYYSGNANTVILNDGLEFQEASNTSQENELNAKEQSFANEIKNIFHISEQYDQFIKQAIMPIATAFVTALNRDFLLEKEKGKYYFAPDTKELYKGSLKERYEAYQIAIDKGFKTRNEIRYLEDDNPIPGLDVINLGLGSVLLDTDTGSVYVPNTGEKIDMGSEVE